MTTMKTLLLDSACQDRLRSEINAAIPKGDPMKSSIRKQIGLLFVFVLLETPFGKGVDGGFNAEAKP